jgi:1-acyl-sn-glycerol-3-phosphate acyltransferase
MGKHRKLLNLPSIVIYHSHGKWPIYRWFSHLNQMVIMIPSSLQEQKNGALVRFHVRLSPLNTFLQTY